MFPCRLLVTCQCQKSVVVLCRAVVLLSSVLPVVPVVMSMVARSVAAEVPVAVLVVVVTGVCKSVLLSVLCLLCLRLLREESQVAAEMVIC